MLRLLSVEFSRFRNLSHVSLSLSPRATIAVGDNGQGKTNLLEGIAFVATLKALRANRLAELVQFGEPDARVAAKFIIAGAEREVGVAVTHAGRTAYVDGKRAPSLAAYFGGAAVVTFTPDDLDSIKRGPEGRRTLLDRAVFNRFPTFLDESRAYLRALKNRNRLLKFRAADAEFEAWDDTLARLGARVWVRRRALLAEVASRATVAFGKLAHGALAAQFRYAPARGVALANRDEATLTAALRDGLVAARPRDLERGFTSVGPHADDVDVTLGEHAARSFASQGQARSLILAWKLAEIENLKDALGYLPLLLLDDVSSELDPDRNAYLMAYLAESNAQTFLTTTAKSHVERAAGPDTLWLSVRAGEISAA